MWNGFEAEKFVYNERDAIIVYPNGKTNGKILLKTEYLDAFPVFDIEMLKRGYYLINIDHCTRWGSEEETHIMAEFVRYCAKKLNASLRCIVEGLSCGGLQGARLVQKYPELVGVLYLDAPVMNIISLAGLGAAQIGDKFWPDIASTYGLTKSTIVNFRDSPMDDMSAFIKNDIPIIMVYGTADTVVVYEENGKLLEGYYNEKGGTLKVIAKPGCDHHPHGLPDPAPIIDFVEQNYRD